MKLIDKILHCPDGQGWTNPNFSRSEKLEKIADDHAIDFQTWLVKNCTLNMKIWTYEKDKSRIYEITELLNIFKKQRE